MCNQIFQYWQDKGIDITNSQRRTLKRSWAKIAVCYYLYKIKGYSLCKVRDILGYKNHSSVIYCINQHKILSEYDKLYRLFIYEFKNKFL
jgi:chromosomal replication initiation ATPase DnaA